MPAGLQVCQSTLTVCDTISGEIIRSTHGKRALIPATSLQFCRHTHDTVYIQSQTKCASVRHVRQDWQFDGYCAWLLKQVILEIFSWECSIHKRGFYWCHTRAVKYTCLQFQSVRRSRVNMPSVRRNLHLQSEQKEDPAASMCSGCDKFKWDWPPDSLPFHSSHALLKPRLQAWANVTSIKFHCQQFPSELKNPYP